MSENPAKEKTPTTAGMLWESDIGTLSFHSRRALVQLLQGPLVQATHHRNVWQAILSDEAALRSRLSELFLDLIETRMPVSLLPAQPQLGHQRTLVTISMSRCQKCSEPRP